MTGTDPRLDVPQTPVTDDTHSVTSVSTCTLRVTPEDMRIAQLTAAAISLSVAELAIPLPLPGVKPGLGNIVVLLVGYQLGLRAACWVSLLRVLGTSLLTGSLFAPGFFFSLAGALASLGVLACGLRLPARWFGPVSLSVLAALAHMSAQLLVARLWLVPHDGVFHLLPILGSAAILFGISNGLICARWRQTMLTDGRTH